MSDSNLASLAYIAETTLGTTPATPELTALRFTGEDLGTNKETVASQEVRSDRQVPDLAKVGLNPSGSIDFELSYEPFKPFIASALGNTVQTVSIAALTVALDSSAQTITGVASDFDDVRVGSLIKISNAADTGNNGNKRVVAKNADGSVITLAAGSLTDTNASDAIDIDGVNVTNGVLKPSFTLEKGIVNSAGADFFQTYLGMVVDSMSIEMESKQIVTGSFEFLGMTAPAGSADTIDNDSTYTDAPNSSIINGTNNFGTISIDGVAASEKFKSISLECGANLRGKDAMGTEGFFDIGTGTFEVTGSLMVYFLDNDFPDLIRNHTSVALEWYFEDPDGNRIYFYLPNVKLNNGDPAIEGINTDVMIEAEFQAIRDATTGITMSIDFIAA